MTVKPRLLWIVLALALMTSAGCTLQATPTPPPTPAASPTPPPIPTDLPATAAPTATLTSTVPPTSTALPTVTTTATVTATTTATSTITATPSLTPTITPLPGRTATATASPNLLENPGFEDGLDDWSSSNPDLTLTGEQLLVPFGAQSGVDFLLMEGGETTAFTVTQDVSVSGSDDDVIELRFFYQTAEANPPDCRVILELLDDNSLVDSNESNALIGEQNTWDQFIVEVQAAADDFDELVVTIECSGGDAGNYRAFDTLDLQLNP